MTPTPRCARRPRWSHRAGAAALAPLLVLAACTPVTAPTAHEASAPPREDAPPADALPVGDGRWSTTGPRRGWVYVCPRYAAAMQAAQSTAAHAPSQRPPWFSDDGKWYYPARKPQVRGDEHHHGTFEASAHGPVMTVRTNSLPVAHGTGIFPIAPADPAWQYDRNPNTISAHEQTYQLPAAPAVGTPRCVSNTVGVMVSGPLLYSALDAAGRDPGAWEVQDSCSGHPEVEGQYHYHTASTCSSTDKPADEVLGWALDGHPITGSVTAYGRRLTNDDLDECHGTTSEINLPTGRRSVYHYSLTREFPYSVGCFRGQPVRADQNTRTGP